MTGPMTFDENGRRGDMNVDIINVREDEVAKVGYWDPDGIHMIGSEEDRESYLYKAIGNAKLLVSTKVVSSWRTIHFYTIVSTNKMLLQN